MEFGLEYITVHAIFYLDEINGVYTISDLSPGGPIVSAPKLEDAKKKFESALKLVSAARNLLFFKGASNSATQKTRRLYTDKIKERIGNVEYFALSA